MWALIRMIAVGKTEEWLASHPQPAEGLLEKFNTCFWRLEEGGCPLANLSASSGAVLSCNPYIWVCLLNWTGSSWRRNSLYPVQGHSG